MTDVLADLDDDSMVLICSPTRYPAVSGSVKRDAICGHEVWVAPSLLEISDDPKGVCICMSCCMESPTAKEILKEQGLIYTAKQRSELNKTLGTSEVDQLMTRLSAREVDVEDIKDGNI